MIDQSENVDQYRFRYWMDHVEPAVVYRLTSERCRMEDYVELVRMVQTPDGYKLEIWDDPIDIGREYYRMGLRDMEPVHRSLIEPWHQPGQPILSIKRHSY